MAAAPKKIGANTGTRGVGRPKGAPNKITRDIRALAGQHSPKAIKRLAYLIDHAESEAAQVAACKELLDRAHGKATQPISGDDTAPPIQYVVWPVPLHKLEAPR